MVPLHPSSTCPIMLKGWGWHAIESWSLEGKRAIPEDVDGKPPNFLMILASRIGLEDSKLIPHTFFSILCSTFVVKTNLSPVWKWHNYVPFSFRLPCWNFWKTSLKKHFLFFQPPIILGPPPPMMEVPPPSSPATPQQSSGSLAWERATDHPVDMGPGVADWRTRMGCLAMVVYMKYQIYVSIKTGKWEIVRTWNFNLI